MLAAVEESKAAGKTKPLGDWRDAHTVNKNQKRVLKSAAKNDEVKALIDLYEKYQERLQTKGRFDYDDMILLAAAGLESEPDMCLDLAERFQYIMVDEYQDTNGAQNRLLDTLLSANPLDSPNVLVVGDDDQAIMRFQGAEVSGMLQFVETYKPTVIVLDENYRSGQPILDASRQIITQTDERLEIAKPELGLTKQLTAHHDINVTIEHAVYASPSAQYAVVADHIAKLMERGVAGKDIAVIGRKHPLLKDFVPFMTARSIAVNYDKRANVISHPYIAQLLDLARLVSALARSPKFAETHLPTVLAAPYWSLPPMALYQIASAAKQGKQSWLETMLAHDEWRGIAEWLIAAAKAGETRNFTQIFDILIGREPLAEIEIKTSPYGTYITEVEPEAYVTLLSHLICLRSAVLTNRPNATSLDDLLAVVGEYQRSETELIDDNPVLRGGDDKVAVMSAHGAKGREFEHVIILSAVDDVWGPKARGNNNRIPLPENLPLYPAGDAESDRLRLLYVAMTRAKSQLLLTSYTQTDNGKKAVPLSFIQLGEQGWWQGSEQELSKDAQQSVLEAAWNPTSTVPARELAEVLQPLTRDFRLSPSSLRSFLDVCYGGPLAAIEQHVLKFPSAYNRHSALGKAVHEALAALQAKKLTADELLAVFDAEIDDSGLSSEDIVSVKTHGHQFLPEFVKQFEIGDITDVEKYFTGTLADGTQIGGQIDALKQTKDSLEVIDYKTGSPPPPDWDERGLSPGKKVSMHFYRQQLLFYKLLLDNSADFGKTSGVTAAELVFVEPNTDGEFVRLPITSFNKAELIRTTQLMAAVSKLIKSGELPDISAYTPDLKGIKQFEADLLGE
jgi:DNA helicase-2/ATP-dependent DNA helicase PcrA